MSNTITISSVLVTDDVVSLTGTVNGVETAASTWVSATTGMTQDQIQTWYAQCLLNSVPQQPVPDTSVTGTVVL